MRAYVLMIFIGGGGKVGVLFLSKICNCFQVAEVASLIGGVDQNVSTATSCTHLFDAEK